MQVGAVLEALTFWLPRRCGGFDGKGVGLSHTHLTVILLPRRLLIRETGCGKKAGRGGGLAFSASLGPLASHLARACDSSHLQQLKPPVA